MLEVKSNFKGVHQKDLTCQAFETSSKSEDHILYCPSYSDLRENMDLNCDLCKRGLREKIPTKEKIDEYMTALARLPS